MPDARHEAAMQIAPFFQNDHVTIYHGNCFEILPKLASESVHLLLADPPYGQDFQSNRRQEQFEKIAGDDGSLDVEAALTAACRLLKRGRHAYIFGPSSLDNTPLAARVELIWDKQVIGTGNLSEPFTTAHEPITFAVYELSKANREKGYGRLAARMRKGSVIRCQRLQSGQLKHPNEKPVRLLRELIESSSSMDETVLDCFMGSGSTLEAAVLEGRKAIGIEIDEGYCEKAARRLEGPYSAEVRSAV